MQTLVANWWALALRGLIGVVFGLLAIASPGLTLTALVLLYGAYAFLDGVLALVAAVRAAERHGRWGWLALEGLAGIGAGIVTFAWPGITAIVLLYLIAAWALVTGILEIAAAVRLRSEIKGEWALVLAGVASVVFGVLLFLYPSAGALAVVWLIGAYALLFGLLMLVLAFRLRGHGPAPARNVPA